MQNLYYLGPLNLFLYSWRFLKELRLSETNRVISLIYLCFECISIVFLPATLYFATSEWINMSAKQEYYLALLQVKESKHYEILAGKYLRVVEILGTLAIVLSCVIITLVLCLIFKISRQVRVGKTAISNKRQVNVLVTLSHILITLAYGVPLAMLFFKATFKQEFRMDSAFYFFGGLLDIFLSVILWFIIGNDKSPSVLVDSNKVYAIIDVTKADQHALIQERDS